MRRLSVLCRKIKLIKIEYPPTILEALVDPSGSFALHMMKRKEVLLMYVNNSLEIAL